METTEGTMRPVALGAGLTVFGLVFAGIAAALFLAEAPTTGILTLMPYVIAALAAFLIVGGVLAVAVQLR